MWGAHADKNHAALRGVRAAVSQVYGYSPADIRRHRKTLDPIALASHDELAGAPVDIVKSERADLASA